MSTSKLWSTSLAKTTGTDKDVTDTMKKKNKQIMELSDQEKKEEENEEKNMNTTEDDSKVKNIKTEIQNIDGFLAESGNCKSQFLPMIYWKRS